LRDSEFLQFKQDLTTQKLLNVLHILHVVCMYVMKQCGMWILYYYVSRSGCVEFSWFTREFTCKEILTANIELRFCE